MRPVWYFLLNIFKEGTTDIICRLWPRDRVSTCNIINESILNILKKKYKINVNYHLLIASEINFTFFISVDSNGNVRHMLSKRDSLNLESLKRQNLWKNFILFLHTYSCKICVRFSEKEKCDPLIFVSNWT